MDELSGKDLSGILILGGGLLILSLGYMPFMSDNVKNRSTDTSGGNKTKRKTLKRKSK
jgi:hypothetical protein